MLNNARPVIPVLDLMIGQVVLATEGNRDAYQPVHSRLSHSSNPVDVAQAIFNQTGCDCLYLADIDSFAGANPNWAVYNDLLGRGFELLVDADWMTDQRAGQIAEKIQTPEKMNVILSSETMSCESQFETFESLTSRGIEPIFSLDKKGDSIITQPGELSELQPLELVRMAYDRGVRNMIVLDLDSVGTKKGYVKKDNSVAPLLQEISGELNDVRLISGGGVKEPADVTALMELGCNHALVATAIHDGKFTPDDIASFEAFAPNVQQT
ncbi:MAG: HisA/HisF-related TIM barrel protein [Mariniblastus sp.]